MDIKLTIALHKQWKKILAEISKRNVYTWEKSSIHRRTDNWMGG